MKRLPLLNGFKNGYRRIFNTYDRDGNLTDVTAPMSEIFKRHLIFRIACIWMVNRKGQILLQKNNKPGHKNYGKWNTGVTGRVSAGDTLIWAAQRELKEELGLASGEEGFIFLETQFFEEQQGVPAPVFFDIWLLQTDNIPAENFVLQASEVAEVRWYEQKQVRNWRTEIEINSNTFDDRLQPLLKWFESKKKSDAGN